MFQFFFSYGFQPGFQLGLGLLHSLSGAVSIWQTVVAWRSEVTKNILG
jgi:hypothetical protein